MLTPTKIGRYEVVDTLGQGAMGTVYKAVDPLIERTVAIKTINLDLALEDRAEFEERFYREAKSAGRLSHANIVTIYDVGETDDVAYIAMEYLEGESLREMLDSGVVLPAGIIVRFASRVAHALHYAHDNQVVHRDIKPANIMITSQRDVKIMDFGIAQMPTGSRTQHGTVLGSPNYMAPEQVRSEPIDGRTDIFALGVVLYEMLTGVSPFKGDTVSATLFNILNKEPPPPSTINSRVPASLDRIVARALAKRPGDRYASAGELARDLRIESDGLPGGDETGKVGGATLTGLGRARGERAASNPADATVLLSPPQAGRLRPAAAAATPTWGAGSLAALSATPAVRKGVVFVLPVALVLAFLVFANVWRDRSDAPGSVLAGHSGKRTSPHIVAEGRPETIAPLLPAVPLSTAPDRTPEAQPNGSAPTALAGGQTALSVAALPADVSPPPAPAVKQAATVSLATVSLAVAPWGEIFVDGKSAGVSPPLNRIELEPGKHRIEIRNQAFAAYRHTVTLEPGETFKIRHKFK